MRALLHLRALSAGDARAVLMAEDPVGLAKQVLSQGLKRGLIQVPDEGSWDVPSS